MEGDWIITSLLILAALGLGGAATWRRLRHKQLRGGVGGGGPDADGSAADHTEGSDLFAGLARTRERLRAIWEGAGERGSLEVIEEALIAADVGAELAREVVKRLRAVGGRTTDAKAFRKLLAGELERILEQVQGAGRRWDQPRQKPRAIVIVGVNGVGKTTSVAKLAYWLRAKGFKVLLVAADTFRAAAAEQLAQWSQRLGVGCVRHQAGSDPAAVVFDGLQAAKSRDVDFVIVDTAGRLHSRQPLVEELKKIVRLTQRELGEESVEVFLVIDATNGQNALVQARVLSEAVPVTGVCLTKLDGTAKGGVAISIAAKLALPVLFVGVGERLEDWEEFNTKRFVAALIGDSSSSPVRDPTGEEGRQLQQVLSSSA
ncbi:MAG: signal recognition particle-docking protein FtsY [Candidatus Binatia bacterium]|nr:signal recognition particle-docking protein FtsY [Candidatus Binatia bacterium]